MKTVVLLSRKVEFVKLSNLFHLWQVVIGDRITLVSVQGGQPLHASDVDLCDWKGCREVNALPASTTAWKLNLFLNYRETVDGFLKGVSSSSSISIQ